MIHRRLVFSLSNRQSEALVIFIFSSYNELVARGMDFGKLLDDPADEEERSGSGPPSRSNSYNASSTSLSSLKSNATDKTEPVEVSKTCKSKNDNRVQRNWKHL